MKLKTTLATLLILAASCAAYPQKPIDPDMPFKVGETYTFDPPLASLIPETCTIRAIRGFWIQCQHERWYNTALIHSAKKQ